MEFGEANSRAGWGLDSRRDEFEIYVASSRTLVSRSVRLDFNKTRSRPLVSRRNRLDFYMASARQFAVNPFVSCFIYQDMEREATTSKSDLTLTNRNSLNISGVKKVRSTESNCVIAVLDNCIITINGTNLSVRQLSIDAGTLELSGIVSSIKYTKATSKHFSLKNMFR